jgi:hypothetical protein
MRVKPQEVAPMVDTVLGQQMERLAAALGRPVAPDGVAPVADAAGAKSG